MRDPRGAKPTAAVSVNANRSPCSLPTARHRGPESSAAPLENRSEQIGVVLDGSSRHDSTQFRSHFRHLKSGNKSAQLVGVVPKS